MAGVAASALRLQIGNTQFDIGFLLGIKAFTAAVLGGIGNLRGALLGGLLLGVVENYAAALFGSSWTDVVRVRGAGRAADVPARPVCWVNRWGGHGHDDRPRRSQSGRPSAAAGATVAWRAALVVPLPALAWWR